jgi:hypothetical protein
MLDGHHDLRARFQAARKVPRVGIDVILDQGLAGGSCRRCFDAERKSKGVGGIIIYGLGMGVPPALPLGQAIFL